MTGAQKLSPPTDDRSWYSTVGGKLVAAFILAAALTVIATLVALVQFHNINAVMSRLTGASLPAVKYSLAVETNAKAIAAGGARLAAATSELQRFTGMSEATEKIGNLWGALSQLRAVSGDTAGMMRLQTLIAGIDERLGQLDRIIRDKIYTVSARDKLSAQIPVATEALVQNLTPFARQGATAKSALELQSDIYRAADLLHRALSIGKAVTLKTLQQQFETVRLRILNVSDALQSEAEVDQNARTAVRQSVQVLLALGRPNVGLFHLRATEIDQQQSADDLQLALQKLASDLETEVNTLVAAAEMEASDATALTAAALEDSRYWLIALSCVSLLAAILIVWLFVVRYIVARLQTLTASMMAVAGGKLDADIPPAGADELGDMSRALVIFRENARDIHRAREEAEKARYEAEAASRTKSSFLANMSHELRTPLNAIIGYSEILREDAVDRGDDASEADLIKIEAAGKHLLGLINDILDLSKIEAGRMDLHFEDVDLKKLVTDVSALVAPLMSKNGNALQINVPANIGSMRVDLVKLKQSLINLLSNAAKFTKDGRVGLTLARAAGADGKPVFTFAVRDSGIGMTEEQIGRLFQAFTQADTTTTRNYGGTGLGLTITKHFCTMLGGSIDVTSKPGEGSVFTITLPEGGKSETPTAAIDHGPAMSGSAVGRKILIVDDDPAVHDVLRITLSKEGYRLLHAYDGTEALDLVRKHHPDVITLDVMMPRVDGWSVLSELKSDPDLARIPVIMLTIVDERTMGYSLGASEYMTKPVDRTRLVELVRRFTAQTEKDIVLVVDDDADVRSIVKTTVEKTGLKTADAVNGQAALDWLAAHQSPSLILLDLMMPVMDGFEFLERVRKNPATAHVPIVVLTAKDLTEDERRLINERTLLVLTKGAQPLSSLGSALSAIARQAMESAQ
ncbi:MAG: response regulator [Pseudorhodoplanes sp.]|jgi:signal transduction histidine kinase/DNA-binding response OmpR family regulator|nr:response regulator [Pseudorhodoplanes sp.]